MSKRIKSICVDARLMTAPGIGTVLKNLFSHFKETPWKWFALIAPDAASQLSKWNHIEPIVISAPIYSIKEQFELPWKIPSVDLFWSPHYNVPFFPIRARRRLVSIHDVYHLAYASKLKRIEKWYAKIMLRIAMRFSDHVITCSLFSKSEIEKYVGIHKSSLSVIPYGVDSSLFSPLSKENSDDVMKKYGIKKPYLLYVGSFKAHKNLKALVEAFSQLIKAGYSPLQLVIVGCGHAMRYCEDVKQLCIDYPSLEGKLCFVGYVLDEELPHFYRNAKAFVFPSFYEGFGFPPLEAMSSGCPAVIARSGALPEVCGEAVIYIDPGSPTQIAAALAELLNEESKREHFSVKGLEKSSLFCWKKCAQQHYAVIDNLMEL